VGKILGKIQQIFVFGFHLNAFYFNKKNLQQKSNILLKCFNLLNDSFQFNLLTLSTDFIPILHFPLKLLYMLNERRNIEADYLKPMQNRINILHENSSELAVVM
jgi:hypothetical protein